MKFSKLVVAIALFVSSLSFEEQVLMTKSGIDVSWGMSIPASELFAKDNMQDTTAKDKRQY